MFKSIADAAKDLTETLKQAENPTTPVQSLAAKPNNFEVPKEKRQSLAITQNQIQVKKSEPELKKIEKQVDKNATMEKESSKKALPVAKMTTKAPILEMTQKPKPVENAPAKKP